ncbi:MAG: sensor histidine kinase [Oscillospiraceae bacterium]
MQTKLLAFIIPLIAAPLIISIAITYNMQMQRQKEQSESFMASILAQVINNLDRYTKELNSLSLMPLMNDDFLDIFRRRQAGSNVLPTYDEALSISRFNVSLMLERSEIKGYLLFCPNGELFSSSDFETGARWLPEQETWMDIARAGEGALVYLPPNIPQYYTASSEYVVSVARLIRDPVTFQELGFVKIDLTNSGFRKILYLDGNEDILFYLYSKNNQLIYPHALGQAFIPKDKFLEINGRDFLVDTSTSDYSGLAVYMLYPYDEFQRDIRHLTTTMLQIAMVSLTLSCLLCIVISHRITKPIRALKSNMFAFSQGNLAVRAVVDSRDEIGALAKDFNHMATRIQRLIKEKYQIELNRREAEILMLQSQINPHFLYNTLETISMSAMSHDDIETSDIVTRLGKMLRYSISVQKELVFLKAEIQFVEDYLALQVIRLGNKLHFEIKMDANLEECLVPKLILQPFVENVVMHALGKNAVHLQLHAYTTRENLLLQIQDNGVGISKERQKEIKTKMYGEEVVPPAQTGYGR